MLHIDEKITTIINRFNLNNYAFSKRIGVTGTTIDSIVNGRPQKNGSRKKTKPGYDVLLAIIDTFDINPDYLFGKSDIMLTSEINPIPTYSGIPQVISTTSEGKENVVFVTTRARAGYLNGYGDTAYIESLPSFKMPLLTNGTFRCFEVQGNSMVQTFYDGDLVFGKYIEAISDIKNNDVYIVVSKNDGVVLKRVFNPTENAQRLILKSDNKDGNFPDYIINSEDVMEIWKVVMYASKQIPKPVDVFDKLHELESKIMNLEHKIH
ncbi:XRE family transcriptional regulator [Psychroserpens ponticola]|uniref:LexA family transcriptional regulator n=1 Tax=Psychroserpens ponticola TaxID=2932268 RepID=A0ABY7RX85_9FLAO|nr:LexA family transcriptional regulator [Psychroserpens ponticola]WCO01692.1 LexA family transcriptional regulator [Psychroserpens ponticola]